MRRHIKSNNKFKCKFGDVKKYENNLPQLLQEPNFVKFIFNALGLALEDIVNKPDSLSNTISKATISRYLGINNADDFILRLQTIAKKIGLKVIPDADQLKDVQNIQQFISILTKSYLTKIGTENGIDPDVMQMLPNDVLAKIITLFVKSKNTDILDSTVTPYIEALENSANNYTAIKKKIQDQGNAINNILNYPKSIYQNKFPTIIDYDPTKQSIEIVISNCLGYISTLDNKIDEAYNKAVINNTIYEFNHDPIILEYRYLLNFFYKQIEHVYECIRNVVIKHKKLTNDSRIANNINQTNPLYLKNLLLNGISNNTINYNETIKPKIDINSPIFSSSNNYKKYTIKSNNETLNNYYKNILSYISKLILSDFDTSSSKYKYNNNTPIDSYVYTFNTKLDDNDPYIQMLDKYNDSKLFANLKKLSEFIINSTNPLYLYIIHEYNKKIYKYIKDKPEYIFPFDDIYNKISLKIDDNIIIV